MSERTDHNEALRLADELDAEVVRTVSLDVTHTKAAALLRQQAERIAELEGERDRLLRAVAADTKMVFDLCAERDQLRAEVERLRVDAERWEWIADGNNFDESFALLTDPKLTTYELTRAVDAARTTHKDEG